MHRALVVETDLSLLRDLSDNLKEEGFTVLEANDGVDGLAKAREEKPDLIVLDILLPGMNGSEICQTLRREMNGIPILILAASGGEIDYNLLELCADDYMLKPFNMCELTARVQALLRRAERISKEARVGCSPTESIKVARHGELTFGELTIDIDRREASINGKPLALRPKEFDLLLFLAQHRGMALSRDLILEHVWGWNYFGGSRTVDVHVHWLRQKIEQSPSNPKRIVTVRGIGYRFEG